MAYFQVNISCVHYQVNWQALISFIKDEWPKNKSQCLVDLEYPIEAKALAMFSMALRLVKAADILGRKSWKRYFIEISMMLFPMIELIGYARLGKGGSNKSLISGYEWLRNPRQPPSGRTKEGIKNDNIRLSSLGRHMKYHDKTGPTLYDMYRTRHYYLHGIKDEDDDINTIQDVLNFELPMSIVKQAPLALKAYWQLLKAGDGKSDWINNLAKAKIYPLIIQSSVYFDKGFIAPEIISWLET